MANTLSKMVGAVAQYWWIQHCGATVGCRSSGDNNSQEDNVKDQTKELEEMCGIKTTWKARGPEQHRLSGRDKRHGDQLACPH